MIRIAACDGEPSFTSDLKKILSEWKHENGKDVEYLETQDPDDLIELCTRYGHMDLVFMSLHPKRGPDGIATARSLKQADKNLNIVFITADRLIDIEVTSLQPLGVLMLPMQPVKLRSCLDRCVQQSRKFFFISGKRSRTAICIDDICYISKKDYPHYRVVIIHCNNGISYMSYMSVKEVEAELERTCAGFIRIQNSCFVNPFYIYHMERSVLQLRQGCCSGDTELYCSRRYGRSAFKAYIEYTCKNIDCCGIAK